MSPTITLLIGGNSSERQVSLASGKAVAQALIELEIKFIPILLDTQNRWHQLSIEQLLTCNANLNNFTIDQLFLEAPLVSPYQIQSQTDLAFIAMHGPSGEDGSIQGFLTHLGLPYTGPGILASSIGMDKSIFRSLLKSHQLPFPPSIEITLNQIPNIDLLGDPPYIVKPHNQGSSVGVSKVNRVEDLPKALKIAKKYSPKILIDKFITGIEITVPVIGNTRAQALPIVEIVPDPKSDFFDYQSKYTSHQTQEIVPARIDPQMTQYIQDLAIKVYQLLNCTGYPRVDFIVQETQAYILEINTLPGLTPMSLLPKSALSHGLSYNQLIQKIIDLALENSQ